MINLMHGDCLELIKDIPDGSVDMVLTDPPYGTMKGAKLDGWRDSSTYWDYQLPTEEIFSLINKKIRVNGIVALFSQEPYTSHLITSQHSNLPFCYRMIWEKDHFANALLANKAPVSYFEDILVFSKKHDNLLNHPLREYSSNICQYLNLKLKEINKKLGHQKAEHFFRWNTSQFSLCTNTVYNEIISKFSIDKEYWYKSYEELKEINKQFNKQFNLHDGKKYKSNILKYKKDYTGFHPTQKPVALLEDLIKTYTNENQTVLDFTMGSGSTGVACLNTNRKFIGIEKDDHYFNVAKKRIEEHQTALSMGAL